MAHCGSSLLGYLFQPQKRWMCCNRSKCTKRGLVLYHGYTCLENTRAWKTSLDVPTVLYKTVSRASQVSGGRNQWNGWFLTSQQLTEHTATPSSQCQLKRRCVSNTSAFVLLLMKLHQREFPKAAGKQVRKARIKPPYQRCAVPLSCPRGFKNAPSHTGNGGTHRAKTWEGEYGGKAGPSPAQKLAEATQGISTKGRFNPFLNHKINCRAVSMSKAERELATQKLQHHPQPSTRAGSTAGAELAPVCSWICHSDHTGAGTCLLRWQWGGQGSHFCHVVLFTVSGAGLFEDGIDIYF